MSKSSQPFRYSMFRKTVQEEDLLRLRNIQVGALLPVLLCFVFFLMTANIYLLFLLLFLLIIGVMLPWILLEILHSHLALQERIQALEAQRATEAPEASGFLPAQ
jgi:hypothetical protein